MAECIVFTASEPSGVEAFTRPTATDFDALLVHTAERDSVRATDRVYKHLYPRPHSATELQYWSGLVMYTPAFDTIRGPLLCSAYERTTADTVA